MIAVTWYDHIIQDVAELINEVYTLDIHLSVTQLGYLKYRGGIEDGDLCLHRQTNRGIATAISRAEGRVTDQVLTSSQELWQATQLTDVLIEVQHTLIGVSQDPAIGVLVDELIMDGLFHLWTIEPVNQARNQWNGTKLFVRHPATHQIVQSLQLRYVGTHLLSELNLTQTQSIDRGDRFFDRCQLAIIPNIDNFALIGSLQDVATEGSVDHRSFIYEDDGVLVDSPASGLLDL